ncbi:unnamed protein product [Debaryomyces fabryi]|nr:unnamed protein product [Debaryomyces fabryi]
MACVARGIQLSFKGNETENIGLREALQEIKLKMDFSFRQLHTQQNSLSETSRTVINWSNTGSVCINGLQYK